MLPPILSTRRLSLAPPHAADLAETTAMWTDHAVYGAITDQAPSPEEVWHRLLRYVGHWQAVGYGTWYVRETATGRFVGEVGLMDSRRATEPGFAGVEAGWALATWAHGRGFGHEALTAALDWADRSGIDQTVCLVAPANQRSIALAVRVGYRFQQDVRYRDRPLLLYRRAATVGADQHLAHAQ